MRIRTMASLLSAAALTASLSIALAATAHADPLVPAGTWNEIFLPFDNGHGNTMCVDDPGGSGAVGTQLQFFHCHGYASNGAPQRWHFFCAGGLGCAFGGRDYQIANADNELCIGFQNDVFGSVGERLVLKSCFQTSGWELVPENAAPGGRRRLTTVAPP